MGLYTMSMCQENMGLLYGVCRCIDLKVQLLTAASAVPNKLTYHLKQDFVLEGWDIRFSLLLLF